MIYSFRHENGIVVRFGPGAHVRIWRSLLPGPAHEILTAHNNRCFHSPGPGDVFREDDLQSVLRGAIVVQVVSHAESPNEVTWRINRALMIVGQEWDLLFANCQDTLSWITTGEAKSFQRDAAIGAALGIGLLGLIGAAISSPNRTRRRRSRR